MEGWLIVFVKMIDDVAETCRCLSLMWLTVHSVVKVFYREHSDSLTGVYCRAQLQFGFGVGSEVGFVKMIGVWILQVDTGWVED